MKNNQKIAEHIEGEKWKQISDIPYAISNLGRVKNIKTQGLMTTEIGRGKAAYVKVRLWDYDYNSRHWYLLHRLLAEAFIPNPQGYPCVNHRDGNKLNNALSNLEWCSYSYNNYHAYRTGLKKCYQQKIFERDFTKIEDMYKAGLSIKMISKEYGVTPSCIYKLAYDNKIKLERDKIA